MEKTKKPGNAWKIWSKEEESKLLSEIAYVPIENIAIMHSRSVGAIHCRLCLIAQRLMESGKSLNEAATITHRTGTDILDFIKREAQKKGSKADKAETSDWVVVPTEPIKSREPQNAVEQPKTGGTINPVEDLQNPEISRSEPFDLINLECFINSVESKKSTNIELLEARIAKLEKIVFAKLGEN